MVVSGLCPPALELESPAGTKYPPGDAECPNQAVDDAATGLTVAFIEPDQERDAVHDAYQMMRSSAPSEDGMQPFPMLSLYTDYWQPGGNESEAALRQSFSATSLSSLPHQTPSLRAARLGTLSSTDSLSPKSVLSSPQLAAMADITPLPSPIGFGSLSPWRSRRTTSRSISRASSTASRSHSAQRVLRSSDSTHALTSSTLLRTRPHPGFRSGDGDLAQDGDLGSGSAHGGQNRNRSLSEYAPSRAVVGRPRLVAVSGTGPTKVTPLDQELSTQATDLHREQYLAVHRGIALPSTRPPTPPRSRRGPCDDSDSEPLISSVPSIDIPEETYSVRSTRTRQARRYRKLRQLGQGTFSRVNLAVRVGDDDTSDASIASDGTSSSSSSVSSRKLVAVKIIDYGPAGGAHEERVEVSLKREVDILRSVNHPSLVQLKAFGNDEKRALLVLDFCPGGDLFEFATSRFNSLSPSLIRRIFAELVAAVRYLHGCFIVHRDIKLENVLVNLPAAAMEEIPDWRTYDRAVVTLTDLGLSRRIPEPPESPLLHTRCGSEDYAAPEILMGQPYDGRLTDAWALGVLLYAMMENRLPFDALPGTRGDPDKLRARTPHRIARCEWSWYRYADDDAEWDPVKGKDLEEPRKIVQGLLKRSTKRKHLDEISQLSYVCEAIDVRGGLKRGDKEVP